MRLKLLRADLENGIFSELESEWQKQLDNSFGPDDVIVGSPYMEHARRIVGEQPPDRRYGIFVLCDEAGGTDCKFKGLLHINHAFSGTSGAMVRMLWVILAPHYDNVDPDPIEIGEILAGILEGGILLCQTDMKARSMKLYLGSLTDRGFAGGVASSLKKIYPIKVAVRGSWLHLDL